MYNDGSDGADPTIQGVVTLVIPSPKMLSQYSPPSVRGGAKVTVVMQGLPGLQSEKLVDDADGGIPINTI